MTEYQINIPDLTPEERTNMERLLEAHAERSSRSTRAIRASVCDAIATERWQKPLNPGDRPRHDPEVMFDGEDVPVRRKWG